MSPRKVIHCAVASALIMLPIWAQDKPSANGPSPKRELRDGTHDFDFDLGVWRTDIVRRVHPSAVRTKPCT